MSQEVLEAIEQFKSGLSEIHGGIRGLREEQKAATGRMTQTEDQVGQLRKELDEYRKRRDAVHAWLTADPRFVCVKPSGAFYLFPNITSFGLKDLDFCNRLLDQEKVAAVPGSAFGAEGYLRLSYATREAIRGISFDVRRNEIFSIIGPAQSGKTSLLRCLNRLEEPSSGSVTVDGVDMLDPRTDINHARQRIGMVFQSFNLYPHLTILDNCTIAQRWVRNIPRAEAEERAMHYLERVRIPDQALQMGHVRETAIERDIA